MKSITDLFLKNIFSIRFDDIPDSALLKLRSCLVDTIGVTMAGAHDLEQKEEEWLKLMDVGEGVIKPIGSVHKVSLQNSIFLNGLSSHFLELDDGVRYGVIHPSAPLVSTLLPIAKVHRIGWKQFALGMICGYETSIRIASAMQPYHYSAGYHPTATCCTLGVAVGIAVMLGFTQKEIKDSLSAASISACGTLKVLEDVSELKPYNCAKAGLMGFFSATMAKAGFTGPNDALGGETGFLKMMTDKYDEDILLTHNGTLYVEKIYQKPYASCRHTHPEIEAALAIRQMDDFNIDSIDSVSVRTYKGVIGKHDGHDIYGESSARMSIPFSLAVSLITGKAGIEEFADPYVNDKSILELTKKIEIVGDEELSRLVPDKRAAIVDVKLKNGPCFSHRVDYPKGEPENPLSETELYTKYVSMMRHAHVSSERYDAIFNEIMAKSEPIIDMLDL